MTRSAAPAALLLLLAAPSVAAGDQVPVVYDPRAADAPTAAELPALVAARTGLPADQLAAAVLDDLLDASPAALGDAVLRRCTGQPTTMQTVEAEQVRAEAAWQARDRVQATDRLDLAVARLGCLGEIVDGDAAARIFLLRGALEAERVAGSGTGVQDLGTARSELRTALAFDPDVQWTMGWPVDGERLLAEERGAAEASSAEATQNEATQNEAAGNGGAENEAAGNGAAENGGRATVVVAPPGTTSGPWLDGRSVPGDGSGTGLRDGLHLAQYASRTGIRSAWLVVGGDATLVLPGAWKRPVFEPLAARTLDQGLDAGAVLDGPHARAVAATLAAALPDFTAAYVSSGDGLWLISAEGEALITTVVAPPSPPAEPEEEGSRKRRKKRR